MKCGCTTGSKRSRLVDTIYFEKLMNKTSLILLKTDEDVEIDLDEVLDIEDDLERRGFVKVILTAASAQSIIRSLLYYFQKILTDSNSSQEIINVRFK